MAHAIRVSGKDGWSGIVHSWFGGPSETSDLHEITVRLDSGETIVVSDTVLLGRPDGSYYVPLSLDEARGAAPPPQPPEPVPEPTAETPPETVGLRVHKSSHDEEQVVDVPLLHERVEIDHVRVDRMVEGPVEIRREGDTVIVPVVEEVLVVQKQLRLVEELHIRKIRTEEHEQQTFVVRKETAGIQSLGEDPHATDDLRPV